jgi:N-acetylmuramoyl-L-alanine amidase
MAIICVDPGHGMSNVKPGVFDPGAVWPENGFTHKESHIVLLYGLALRDALRASGHEVFMTRDDDEDHAPVGERAGNAERAGCSLLISIHVNSHTGTSAHGVETLYRDDDDKPFAEALNAATVQATGLRDRGVKQRTNLAVLRFKGRAALIELGFLSNDGDRKAFLNPAVRHAVVKNVAGAVTAFV